MFCESRSSLTARITKDKTKALTCIHKFKGLSGEKDRLKRKELACAAL